MIGLVTLGAVTGFIAAAISVAFGAGVVGALIAYSVFGTAGMLLAAVTQTAQDEDFPFPNDYAPRDTDTDTLAQWETDPESRKPIEERKTNAA